MSVRVTDPAVTIAGMKQFGLAPDGSDLRDLCAAFERQAAEIDRQRQRQAELMSEASELASNLRRAIAENERLRADNEHLTNSMMELAIQVRQLTEQIEAYEQKGSNDGVA